MRGIVSLYDDKNEIIDTIEITKLPVKEERIIERSVKEFNDDSPCVIHRRACSIKILMELKENIETNYKHIIGETIKIDELAEIKNTIEFKKDVTYIQFE